MMEKRAACRALLCLLGLVCLCLSDARTSNVCTRIDCTYVTVRVCAYETWLGCCLYKTVRQPVIISTEYCCPGWSSSSYQRCNIPVCNPTCQNGGTCSAPNRCDCLSQNTGPLCAGSQCSHQHPCYPGTCQPGTTNCKCTSGFTTITSGSDQKCLKLLEAPQILQMQVRLAYWATMKGSWMEMYAYVADSTNSTDMDSIWTNRQSINQLQLTAASQFSAGSMTPPPDYISGSGLGIVSGSITVRLTKIPIASRTRRSTTYISQNETFPCNVSASPDSPVTSVFNCTMKPRFDRSLENGDNLTITFNTENGGFRVLRNLDTRRNITRQNFIGQGALARVQFRFDFEPPFHCQERSDCTGSEMIMEVPDVTKVALQVRWSGWQDLLSGMDRYTVEVFPLISTSQNTLTILRPLEPLFITQVNESKDPLSVTYLPPSPGMYAVILEAADLANNTKYVRRLALYDNVSSVTTDTSRHLRFVTASPVADYSFQNTTGPIVLTWEGFFRNELHEQNGWLNAVDSYPRQLEDNRKTIDPHLDDNQDRRTVRAIDNRRGIVKFEVAEHRTDEEVGEESLMNPPPGALWLSVGLNQTWNVTERVNHGDSVLVWVRASDILGNTRQKRAIVTFDLSPPTVAYLTFEMNTKVPGIAFSSTFHVPVEDKESGIAYINWRFTRENGTVIFKKQVSATTVQTCLGTARDRTCFCNRRGQCFQTKQSLSVSNCKMMVEKERLATEIISVTADVVNMAGLVTSRSMQKGRLADLNGTEEYFPPQNVRVARLSESGASLTWDFPPSCYPREDIMVVYPDDNGQNVTVPVHRDATQFDFVGLEPSRKYRIHLITAYVGNINSDARTVTFTTMEQAGLTVGEKAGIGIGVVLFLVLLVVVALLVQSRRNPAQFRKMRDSIRNSITARKETAVVSPPVTYNQEVQDEDLYLPAGQTWSKREAWQIETTQLTLHDQIGEGRFADIFRATWKRPDANGQLTTVAAKMLKGGFGQNEVNRMMSKIQFFVNSVGCHDNVLLFQGAVMDNEFWGPVMVLEYCELGPMDKWLQGQQAKVTEETVEKLFRFCKDIACGMEHLASRKIVHSRLAARNVLLTFLLDAKVAGFGPQDAAESKVSAKWSAPEILEEKPPTEKSDVWSYGVTLWEVFSLGKTPYSGVSGREIGTFIKAGNRMEKPELANDMFHKLMQQCWQENPGQRPRFADISKELRALFGAGQRRSEDYYYMSINK